LAALILSVVEAACTERGSNWLHSYTSLQLSLKHATYQGMRFNHDEMHIVCPWHGWEYDLETGVMVADRTFRLRKYDVVEKEDGIYVLA